MAYPTLTYNTSTGSDTQASGSEPVTAIFGATGSGTGADTAGIANTVIKLNGPTV